MFEKYEDKLTPYTMNGSWKKDNPNYTPIKTCFAICREIENNKQALGTFLKEIFSKIVCMDEEDFIILKNYLEIIGYELKREHIDEYDVELYKFTLIPVSDGVIERQQQKSFLIEQLEQKHPELLSFYLEAISNYGNSEFKSCIENSRSVFEGFFKKIDNQRESYLKGILTATGEEIIDENSGEELTSNNKIFRYWLENHKGANRYRVFVSLYSGMSGLGTHGEEIPSKEDVLMFLRMVEDVLIWCFQNNRG